jgi:hypothetical protein
MQPQKQKRRMIYMFFYFLLWPSFCNGWPKLGPSSAHPNTQHHSTWNKMAHQGAPAPPETLKTLSTHNNKNSSKQQKPTAKLKIRNTKQKEQMVTA